MPKFTTKATKSVGLIETLLTPEHVGTQSNVVLSNIEQTDAGNTVFKFSFPDLSTSKNKFYHQIVVENQAPIDITTAFIYMNAKDLDPKSADYKDNNADFKDGLTVEYTQKTKDGAVIMSKVFNSLSEYKLLDTSLVKLYAIFNQCELSYPTHINPEDDFDKYCKYMMNLDYTVGVGKSFSTKKNKFQTFIADVDHIAQIASNNDDNVNMNRLPSTRRQRVRLRK